MEREEDDAGGKCEAVCGDASSAEGGVSRAPGTIAYMNQVQEGLMSMTKRRK